MAKLPTVYDVARRSGVSVATVSRVLGGSGYPVKQETREKVLAAARALHYTPNAIGKGLKTHISHDLGVILPTITNPSYAMLLHGIQKTAAERGYTILLCNSERDARREAKNIQTLMEKRVAGILLASISPDGRAARRALGAGYVLLTVEQPLALDCIHVGYDYLSAGRMMARHLVERGHRRIGFIGAPLDRPSRKELHEGFLDGLRMSGLSVREEDMAISAQEAECGDVYEMENGLRGAAHFLQMDGRPTAYACINDLTALGAMRGFARSGLRVPEDASVIGFDNIPYCTLGEPPLTTIDQHAQRMGEIAARLVIEQIRGPHRSAPHAVSLAPELVVRQSVGAWKERSAACAEREDSSVGGSK